jgi:hypothetical protein
MDASVLRPAPDARGSARSLIREARWRIDGHALVQSPDRGFETLHLGSSCDSTDRFEDKRPHHAPRYAEIVTQELDHVPGELRELLRRRMWLENHEDRKIDCAPVAR